MRFTPLVIVLLLTLHTAVAFPAAPPIPGAPAFSFAQNAREQLTIKRLSMPLLLDVAPGEAVPLAVEVKNNDAATIRNGVSVTVSIPQLGLRKRAGPDTLLGRAAVTKKVMVQVPEAAKPGIYLARITVSTDRFHRTIYRLVNIAQH
ncbi:hypothetical protein HY639_06170 [Candidatus Woesearchaeota archaeon]|nr:hypothetical protein [Candidatus Woesearchaeota archaeon]